MNLVLDNLLLRRPRILYVSPPVCPTNFSGSGSGVVLEAAESPTPPSGLQLVGQCSRFVIWSGYPDLVCMSLYRVDDPGQLLGSATLLAECVPPGFVGVCSPGWWKITTLTAGGVESAQGDPVFSPGGFTVYIPVPQNVGAVRTNVYKNPDPVNPLGTFGLVLSTVSSGAIEVCDPAGCYRLQATTDDGVSELSTPICRDATPGCCSPRTCSSGYQWDPVLCSCVPVPPVIEIDGPTYGACLGIPYASQLTVVGGTPPYHWEQTSGALPDGLVLHTGFFTGNTAPITGTPTSNGLFTFEARVDSSEGLTATTTFSISVPSVLPNPTLPPAVIGVLYSETLAGFGGNPPYAFALMSGVLPGDMTLSSDGILSGTADVSGVFVFDVQVTDSKGSQCLVSLSITVGPPPSINIADLKAFMHNWAQSFVYTDNIPDVVPLTQAGPNWQYAGYAPNPNFSIVVEWTGSQWKWSGYSGCSAFGFGSTSEGVPQGTYSVSIVNLCSGHPAPQPTVTVS